MKIESIRDKLPIGVGRSAATATDYRHYTLSAFDIAREGLKGVGLAALIAYTFYKSFPVFLVAAPLLFILVPIVRRPTLLKNRQWELGLEFREAIWLMSGFMSAGLSPENALIRTIPELERLYGEKSMICREFQRIAKGVSVNIPIERLFIDLGVRSGVGDIKNFAHVFRLVKRSGGNMRDTVKKTTDVIRDKVSVSEEIHNMTAGKRYEQSIMNIIPFAIILYINITSGDFLDCMYESPAGRLVMTVSLLLLGVSYILSQRILNISM